MRKSFTNADTIVNTKYGSLNGTTLVSTNGTEFRAFYGIPYAAPPVGKLRLKNPVEPEPWNETRQATTEPAYCLQAKSLGAFHPDVVGQEDCLYLNVFTPKTEDGLNDSFPVLVYIHGGGFTSGYGHKLKPDYILNHNVILVTLNYRLGPVGFLGMGDDAFSGNFGLKDQSMALRWVKNNIEAFGGNSNSITLFGQSAGSACVHFHLFSSMSKGLFHKVIMQSGNSFNQFSFYNKEYAKALTTAFAVSVGCYKDSSEEMISCLQKLNPDTFVDAEIRIYSWEVDPTALFKPIIEGEDVKEPFITQQPSKSTYVTKGLPTIAGVTTGEGAFKVGKYLSSQGKQAKQINANYRYHMPLILQYGYTAKQQDLDNITESIKSYYFQDKEIGASTDKKFVEMITDSYFGVPLNEMALSYPGPLYVYQYDHRAVYSYQTSYGYEKDLGVCHSDELPMLFYKEEVDTKMSEADKKISKQLLNYWINFAIYGNPNGNSTDDFWKPKQTDDVEFLHISTNGSAMESRMLKEKYEFWKSIPLGRTFE